MHIYPPADRWNLWPGQRRGVSPTMNQCLDADTGQEKEIQTGEINTDQAE